jgi:AcrR family transcriptional regulator
MNPFSCSAPKGRPREFCVDAALAAALRVFWTKGYEGASLSDLTEAMGINKPSLYAAFGNKEALFRKALDLYELEKLAFMHEALNAPTARGVAEQLLRGALALQSSGSGPKGCMGVIHTVACGTEAESIRAEVIARGDKVHRALVDRLERAKADGDLPSHIEPTGLAAYLKALLQGLSLQASAGATPGQLDLLVQTSLAFWPSREAVPQLS